MIEIKIEIENIKLAEMGVDQPIRYRPFRFNKDHFIGYWISVNDETFIETIIFYVGSQTFNCKCCQKYIDLFDSILNESSSSNNNI